MKNLIRSLIFSLILVGITHAQKTNEVLKDSIKTYTIENCVNQFNMENSVSTKVGYQYWFADKDFLDGRTLKMSVVAPRKSTHAPHQHIEDEFFFVLEGTAEFFLDGKTQTAGAYTSFYFHLIQCMVLVILAIPNLSIWLLKNMSRIKLKI